MGRLVEATLHQSAIELRGSTVVSASRGVKVEVSAQSPYARKKMVLLLLVFCVLFPPSICLCSDETFISPSVMYSLLQSCVCPQTGTLSSVRLFL